MTALFVFGAVVQINDPDPIQWMAIYSAAAVVSGLMLRRRQPHPALPLAVGTVALVWGVLVALYGPGAAEYARMFDAWEMESAAVEEAREATGLMIIAVWMTVLAIRVTRRAG